MDSEVYRRTLNAYDMEISNMELTLRNISNEIYELEIARENAKSVRNDFDQFVARKRQKNSKTTRGIFVKSFSSFINKASNMLTGIEYTRANENIEEINHLLSRKLLSLDSDMEYCRQELRKLKWQREIAYQEYLSSLEREHVE